MGGTGNQMFQYALYRSLRAQGKKVFIDDIYSQADSSRKMILKDCFQTDYKKLNPIISRIINPFKTRNYPIDKIVRIIFGEKIYDDNRFNKNIFNLNKGQLIGWWQSEKYFSDSEVIRQLHEDFRLSSKLELSKQYCELKQEIENCNSVGIHIRRTDYVTKHIDVYGGICTYDYYLRGINYISQKDSNLKFYVFSDDKEYIREKYGNKENYVIINHDKSMSDVEEMFLMSACKHHVMANSSYSWWAMWLNDNPDSINVAPDRWINRNKEEYEKIYTDKMIRIKCD